MLRVGEERLKLTEGIESGEGEEVGSSRGGRVLFRVDRRISFEVNMDLKELKTRRRLTKS